MGWERCYGWSSLSCSSASTTSSLTSAADGILVKMELEAAEALADLAHLAVQESAGSGLCRKWGSKGKRAAKRVKSESPPGDSAFRLNPLDSVPSCSDLAEDRAEASQQQCEKIRPIVLIEREKAKQVPSITEVKAEQDSELAKPTPNCNGSFAPFVFCKTRQKLTEAEKEEQRIRRVLANRESARQTIRRRQALCEDLTRKAADLARENENLKRDKELALKEHQSLETTNKHLKQQMAKVRKAVVEETPGEHYSADVAASLSSSRNCPWHLYDHPPFLPVLWPSVIQSSTRVQSQYGRQSAIVIPSNMPMPAACGPDNSQEQENRVDVNGQKAPLYVLPCPWFFPLPGPGNRLQPLPSTGMKYEQGEASRSNHNASSSSKFIAHVENRHCSLPIEVKTQASGSSEVRPANDLNETPMGFPLDGVSQHTGANSEEILYTPASLDCSQPASTIKHENMSQSAYAPNIETTSTARPIASALPEKQESAVFPSKKLIDTVAAAEARKRRKELTKLKNLHGRPCQMHC